MRRRYSSAVEDEAQIDLTPMLDVVFIMLIFFIVTASFVREFGLDIKRPEESAQQQKTETENVLVSIDSNNQIFINREPRVIDVGSVRANIERLVAANPEASVIIQSEKGAKVGTFSSVYDAAFEAGVPPSRIVMATE